jgi:hypothetical protein
VVGAGADQFVILFERDVAAPVSGERLSCPDGENQAADANRGGGDLQKCGAREDLQVHRLAQFRIKEHPPAESDRNSMRQHGRHILPFDNALGAKGVDEPDEDEHAPAGDDDVAGDLVHRQRAHAL